MIWEGGRKWGESAVWWERVVMTSSAKNVEFVRFWYNRCVDKTNLKWFYEEVVYNRYIRRHHVDESYQWQIFKNRGEEAASTKLLRFFRSKTPMLISSQKHPYLPLKHLTPTIFLTTFVLISVTHHPSLSQPAKQHLHHSTTKFFATTKKK